MTDPKHPALLAAERWFATEQTRDLVTETECEACAESNYLVALEKLRGLARIAFVTGYEAGKKARGASVSNFIGAEAGRFELAAYDFNKCGRPDAADRCSIKAAHSRTLAAQVARGDDENTPD